MTEFRKYMHVEKFGNTEVQGIECGDCYVFPKLDGTNGSIWLGDESSINICAGSRNRKLSLDSDNAGFCRWVEDEGMDTWMSLFKSYPDLTVYGEWLVPHSLRTYREEAWRRFYVFDIWDNQDEKYLDYVDLQLLSEQYKFRLIKPLAILKNATYENFLCELNENTYLIKDECGVGEGVVLKNYDYKNKYGRTTWAKIVTTKFKDIHREKSNSPKKEFHMVEQDIVDLFVTDELVQKVYAKIVNENNGWSSKYIPRLLQTVFYDLVREECWEFVKKMKMPTINFKTLNNLTILKTKELKIELF